MLKIADSFLKDFKWSSRVVAYILGVFIGTDFIYPESLFWSFFDLKHWDNGLLQGFGIVLLTIIIPLAIAIINEAINRKTTEVNHFHALDMHVILDRVFKVRLLLFYSFLIFLVSLFIGLPADSIRFTLILVYLISIFNLFQIILDVHRWLKGDVWDYRLSYLNKLESNDDLPRAWNSFWQGSIITYREVKFFKTFTARVDSLIYSKEWSVAAHLINDFSDFLLKRTNHFLVVHDELISTLLRWRHAAWLLSLKSRASKNAILWGKQDGVERTLDRTITHLGEYAFDSNDYYGFLKSLDAHLDKTTHNEQYTAHVIHLFCNLLFLHYSKISNSNVFWRNSFLGKCKINSSKMSLRSSLVFDRFAHIVSKQIGSAKSDKHDNQIDDIIDRLFPAFDPPTLAVILMIRYSSYDPENRMRSLILHPWPFGLHIGSHRVILIDAKDDSSEINQQISLDKSATFDFAMKLFPSLFTNTFIQQSIEELKQLEGSYDSGSYEELKRVKLLKVFEGLSLK